MRHHRFGIWCIRMLSLWGIAQPGAIHAQVNSWSNPQSGSWNWGGTTNWSLNAAPAINQTAIFITNLVSGPTGGHFRTINIDSTTSASTLTITNLTVSAPGTGFSFGSHNTLVVSNNAGTPLRIIRILTIANGGNIFVTNSTLQVDALSGGFVSDDGILTLDTGSLITTNTTAYVGDAATGQVTVSDGTWLAGAMVVGSSSGASGALFLGGGTITLSSSLVIGASGTGLVSVTGGQLNTTNEIFVGEDAVGQVTVSNGTWLAGDVYLGLGVASQGTVIIAAGNVSPMFSLEIGYGTGSTGTLWLTGGLLNATNETSIGWSGVGQMTVSNGTWTANNVYVANQFGSGGTLTVAGGTTNLMANLQVAASPSTTGTVWLTGGQLKVTNEVFIGESSVGQMTVSNGNWLAGLVGVGNGLGSSGTLSILGGSSTLSSSLEIAHSSGTARRGMVDGRTTERDQRNCRWPKWHRADDRIQRYLDGGRGGCRREFVARDVDHRGRHEHVLVAGGQH